MARSLKSAITFEEQIARFNRRGMHIEDESGAIAWLQQTNYYRLTGYSFQLMSAKGRYKKSASFDLITHLYMFDQKMRHILIAALEDIEVYARTTIAYWFSHSHEKDGGAHYNPAYFIDENYHADYVATLEKQIEKNKKSTFVCHHIDEYGGKMPLWCAVEILPFSSLSMLYNNMQLKDQKTIAEAMGLDEKYVANWLHCFAVLRNTCAHYGRLYNTILSPPVSLGGKTFRRYPTIINDTLYAYIVAMLRILPRKEQKKALCESIVALVHEYEPYVELGLLAFPDEWEDIISSDDILKF